MRRLRLLRAGLPALPLVVALLCAVPADAQPGAKNQPISPPTPKQPDEPPIIMNYLVMLALAAAVIGANAIPSKRGHQD